MSAFVERILEANAVLIFCELKVVVGYYVHLNLAFHFLRVEDSEIGIHDRTPEWWACLCRDRGIC